MPTVREIHYSVKQPGFGTIRGLPTDGLYYSAYMACCELDVPFGAEIGYRGAPNAVVSWTTALSGTHGAG